MEISVGLYLEVILGIINTQLPLTCSRHHGWGTQKISSFGLFINLVYIGYIFDSIKFVQIRIIFKEVNREALLQESLRTRL